MHWIVLQPHPPGIIVNIVGMLAGILWSLAYIGIIRKGHADQFCGMPLAALIANVTWEFIFSFIYKPPLDNWVDWFSYLMALAWFILDVYIVFLWFKYWSASWPSSVPGKYHYPLFVVGLGVAFGIIIGAVLDFGYPLGGVYASFAQNLMMSVLFMARLAWLNTTRGQSMFIALTKMFGTAAASAYWYWQGKTQVLWVALFVSIYIFDLVYTTMLRYRLHGAPTPAPA